MQIQSTSEITSYFTLTKCNKLCITYLSRSTDRKNGKSIIKMDGNNDENESYTLIYYLKVYLLPHYLKAVLHLPFFPSLAFLIPSFLL